MLTRRQGRKRIPIEEASQLAGQLPISVLRSMRALIGLKLLLSVTFSFYKVLRTARILYPRSLTAQRDDCDHVTEQMQSILRKLSPGRVLRRVLWITSGRDEMNHLRSTLEAHESTVAIALTTVSM